jgi:hypothetical protein
VKKIIKRLLICFNISFDLYVLTNQDVTSKYFLFHHRICYYQIMADLIISGVDSSTGQRKTVSSGDTVVDSSGNLILAGGVELLGTVSGINAKSTGTTDLYTVPTDTTVVVTEVIFRVMAADTVTAAPTLGVGIASGEDDIASPQGLTGISAVGDTFTLDVSAKSVQGNAADVIRVGIDTAATATTLTLAADLIGYVVGVVASGNQEAFTVWTSYTPTITGWTAGFDTPAGLWRRNGPDTIQVQYYLVCNAAPTPSVAKLSFALPSGFTIDHTKLVHPTNIRNTMGTCRLFDTSTGDKYYGVSGVEGAVIRPMVPNAIPSTQGNQDSVRTDQPFAWASGDEIMGEITLPVNQVV